MGKIGRGNGGGRREPPSLDSVEVKIKRAKFHLDDLNDRFDRLVKSGAYRFEPEVRSDQLMHIYRADHPPVLDLWWSTIVADCVHNLRTALDHLAWQLVRSNGRDRPPNTTKFPIFDRPPDTRRMCLPWPRKQAPFRIAGGVDPEALKLIEEVQPYNGTEEGGHLRAIRELDNFDKHRDLVVVAGAVHMSSTGGSVGPDGTVNFSAGTKFTGLPIKHKQVVACVHYSKPQPQPDPHLSFRPFIVLSGKPYPNEILGMGLLPTLISFVEGDFLPRFAPFFPPPQ